MIKLMDLLSILINITYCFTFYKLISSFLQLRRSLLMKITAFIACHYIATAVIYANDIFGILGFMVGFFFYLLFFYQGKLIEKVSVLLVFYPALIAINYLMVDIGTYLFYSTMGFNRGETISWTPELHFASTSYYTVSLLLRLAFWAIMWLVMHRYLSQITSRLTIHMWLIVDMLMLASFVAIFTIILFMPDRTAIAYPICGASIFSSFGCMYLASYICRTMQATYRVQELEMQCNYYKDRMKDENRVRSIYHDLKNHLLLLQSQDGSSQEQQPVQSLQYQLEGYENYHNTKNEFLDIIIRDKSRAAQKKQIDFSAVIHFEDGSFLEPLDISTIFGNALDNAIEASEKLPQDQRLITIKSNRIRDMLIIIFKNNTAPNTALAPGTTKTDTFIHGFGLTNIKKAVEKYEGKCIINTEQQTFTLKIMIPIPQSVC